MKNEPDYIVIDLFCGAGGTTIGLNQARVGRRKPFKVIMAVNHDPICIKSHWSNHKTISHFEEDVRTVNLQSMLLVLNKWRAKYPNAKVVLWASLECTNYSNAKGGLAKNAESRTLPEALLKVFNPITKKYELGDSYIQILNPDIVMIENVREFRSWGPLDENNRPLSRLKGTSFVKWCNEIKSLGYTDDWRLLNAADFGAFTSRKRLFGIFAKNGSQIAWPTPTHSKLPNRDVFGKLKKWRAVKHCLELETEGKNLFKRKIQLKPKSLERIFGGLVKSVAGGNEDFLLEYSHILENYKGLCSDSNSFTPSITLKGELGLMAVSKNHFLTHYYGNGFSTPLTAPCPTLRTKDSVTKISVNRLSFIEEQYGNGKTKFLDKPAGSITTVPKFRLVTAKKQVVSDSDMHHFLLNPQYDSNAASIDKPCFTLIASMNKRPPHLVTIKKGQAAIVIYKDDCYEMVKIKCLMAEFGLTDIFTRMLFVRELKKIQGFPSNYLLHGTQEAQKRAIGNSVVPEVVKAWSTAIAIKKKSLSISDRVLA